MNFFSTLRKQAQPAAQEAVVKPAGVLSGFEAELKRAQAEPFDIKSTCQPRANILARPAVRIKASGEVVPLTEANQSAMRALVVAGLAVEIMLEPKHVPGTARVFVRKSESSGEVSITFACNACRQSTNYSPKTQADVDKFSFTHCGTTQQVPADVARQYLIAKGAN